MALSPPFDCRLVNTMTQVKYETQPAMPKSLVKINSLIAAAISCAKTMIKKSLCPDRDQISQAIETQETQRQNKIGYRNNQTCDENAEQPLKKQERDPDTDYEIIDSDKAEQQLVEYSARSVHYTLLFSTEGEPIFLLHECQLKKTWTSEDTSSRVIAFHAHAFIEITIENLTFNLPLCLLQEDSIRSIKLLLLNTVDPKDGRYGSKETGFIVPITIIDINRRAVIVKVNLRSLSLQYVTMQNFPKSALQDSKSPLCPFCQKV
jgi:hypothetical protein